MEHEMHHAERGLFDLRQGRPLYIMASERSAALIATVDGLAPAALEQLRRFGSLRLAVTCYRAESMGFVPSGDTLGHSLSLNGEGPEQIFRLASANGTVDASQHDIRPATDVELAGLTLARLGRLLPAVVCADVSAGRLDTVDEVLRSGAALSVTTAQIGALASQGAVRVMHVSDGAVPLAEAEDARFMAFREANGLMEHVAVLIGQQDRWPDPVPVRIHSACLTGDLFGSLRCDCGEQLRGSLRMFAKRGGGVLLYMSQEGRDIGLGNKLRAYTLQEQGLDTFDADRTLGFGADERRYGAAIEMLKTLKISRVELLTNNPEKVRVIREAGIDVVERRPLYGTLNRHNLPYVKAKVERAGHWLTKMLSGTVPTK